MPPRMIAFDTESKSEYDGDTEVQSWRVGCAIRWRTDLKTGDHREAKVFDNPESFWSWVAEYTRKGSRTVVWAHNMGYDVRISRMFDILPSMGFHLEWCNLDRNISSATWRSDHGTIVLADTWTWVPLPLAVIAGECGTVKYDMPSKRAPSEDWARYCMQDCEITYRAVTDLMNFITTEHLGNWQPTGAGMAYAGWRHRFLNDKVLVHDDVDALEAERLAMHTGRAEAWRHGELIGQTWVEVDLNNAYLTIASDTSLPRKLHMHHNRISVDQYTRLRERFAVLSRVVVRTSIPVVPVRINGRHLWPVGEFETWLWDNELDMALRYGAGVEIQEGYTYVRSPILSDWALFILGILRSDDARYTGLVRTHVKHCGRALIGRIALRTPSWEYFGTNIDGFTGITHAVFPEENRVARMLHVGGDTLIETARTEGKDSLPMVTGYIMAECRVRLWEAMNIVGLDNIAHVDTDSILCDSRSLDRLRVAYGASFLESWKIKGSYKRLEIYGPRAYFRDKQRMTSGIPLRAQEKAPGEYEGERWSSLATDLERGQGDTVSIAKATWRLQTSDPRRADLRGSPGRTRALDAGEC